MKEKTYKWLSRFFIATGIIYWVVLILAATTGCTTMQSDVINLKEPIGNGWIMERKDFKAYKDPNETIIHLDEPLGARDYWEREDFLRHFDY